MNGYTHWDAGRDIHRGGRDHRDRDRGGRPSYVSPYAYGYGDYLVPNFVGYPFGLDPGFNSDDFDQSEQSSAPQPGANAGEEPQNYAEEPPPSPPLAAPQGAGDVYRPPYSGPVSTQPVRPQPATALVFMDGRPNEEVHNYVLTGTTLYDLDGDTRKEIPLSELNVPATVERNRAAGVDFNLPTSR